MGTDRGAHERREGVDEDVREFRLEGLGLALVGALLLAALSGAFYLGRWYESRRAGTDGPMSGNVVALPGADASTRSKVVSAEEGTTAFDDVGPSAVAEPGREARAGSGAARPAAESDGTDAGRQTESGRRSASQEVAGAWTIQVAAVRDRRSAEKLYGELVDQGFAARIDAVRDGPDTVFKVRVGGFAERDDTASTSERLTEAGYQGWVTRVD